jgi:hypothetical protein
VRLVQKSWRSRPTDDPEVSAYLKAENFVMVKVNGESSSKMHWQGGKS